MLLLFLFLTVLLMYSNGANDDFKGVATLWGSGTLAHRPALGLATRYGFPAFTTPGLVGSIYGIGRVNGTANSCEIARIGLSWLLTLPVAALIRTKNSSKQTEDCKQNSE